MGNRLSEFWNHRTTESFWFEGTSGGLLVQPPNWNRANLKVSLGFIDLPGVCYIENVSKSTLILKRKYCFLHLWDNSEGGGEKRMVLYVIYKERKYKVCKGTLDFCKIFSWAVTGSRTESILWCTWHAALVLTSLEKLLWETYE